MIEEQRCLQSMQSGKKPGKSRLKEVSSSLVIAYRDLTKHAQQPVVSHTEVDHDTDVLPCGLLAPLKK